MTDVAALGLKVDSTSINKASAEMAQAVTQAEALEGSTQKMSSAFFSLKGILATLGISLGFREMLNNTTRQEEALAHLTDAVASFRGELGFTVEDLTAYAGELQKATTFGDEAIMEMQTSLLRFGNVSGEVFLRAQKASIDMAARMKMDLTSTSRMIAMALEQPEMGMQRLRYAGVVFSDSQKQMVQDLVRTGQLVKAQELILGEFEAKLGGAAETSRKTLGGALTALKNAFGDLLEVDKNVTEPLRRGLETLTDNLSETIRWATILASVALAPFFGKVSVAVTTTTASLWKYITVTRVAAAAELASAKAALASAEANAKLTMSAHVLTAAKARLAVAQAANIAPARALLRLMGGWPGVVMGIVAALGIWAMSSKKTAVDMDELRMTVEKLQDTSFDPGSVKLRELIDMQNKAEALRKELKEAPGMFEVFFGSKDRKGMQFALLELEAGIKKIERARKSAAEQALLPPRDEKAIKDLISALEEKSKTLGLTEHQLLKYKLGLAGATEEEIKQAYALQDVIESILKKKKADEEAEAAQKSRQNTIVGMISSLKEESETIGLTNNELQIYKLRALEASAADIERAESLLKLVDAANRNRTALGIEEELRNRINTLGKTETEIILQRVTALGAEGEARKDNIQQLLQELELKQRDIELQTKGKSIMEANLTPMEKLNAEMKELVEIYEAGALGIPGTADALEQFNRAAMSAHEQYEQSTKKSLSATEELEQAILGYTKSASDGFVDFITGTETDFAAMVRNMIIQLLKLMVYQKMSGMYGKAASWIGNAMASANGNVFSGGQVVPFAKGGAFTNQIVTQPTAFDIGTMAEKSPEAIMPLERDSNGRLGVIATGVPAQAQAAQPPQVNVRIVNVEDESKVESYMSGPGGDRIIRNWISQNPGVIRQVAS